jgi:hypothetical protein
VDNEYIIKVIKSNILNDYPSINLPKSRISKLPLYTQLMKEELRENRIFSNYLTLLYSDDVHKLVLLAIIAPLFTLNINVFSFLIPP